MKILLASPRGFCAGVNRAVETLHRLLECGSESVYALHELVHNRQVVENFRASGVTFVESLDDVPLGKTVLFSAHGVAPAVRDEAKRRFLKTVDATCPLVERVHQLAKKYAEQNYRIFYIGHKDHQEVIGTLGEAPEKMTLITSADDVERLDNMTESKLTYLMQTTLSCTESDKIVWALKAKFPSLIEPDNAGICFATRHRQEAVSALLPEADALVVVGSANSSNSRRLAELGEAAGVKTQLIDRAADLSVTDFNGSETVLLTAGASAPESLVNGCVEYFQKQFNATVDEQVVHQESVVFKMPEI